MAPTWPCVDDFVFHFCHDNRILLATARGWEWLHVVREGVSALTSGNGGNLGCLKDFAVLPGRPEHYAVHTTNDIRAQLLYLIQVNAWRKGADVRIEALPLEAAGVKWDFGTYWLPEEDDRTEGEIR